MASANPCESAVASPAPMIPSSGKPHHPQMRKGSSATLARLPARVAAITRRVRPSPEKNPVTAAPKGTVRFPNTSVR